VPLTGEEGGYFSGFVEGLSAGALYKIRLDGGDFPDPASRFQPEGPSGPSELIDGTTFEWQDGRFEPKNAPRVLYELHVGTFTREGTYAAAAAQFAALAELGITTLELMPLAAFPGKFGWGYDGVNLWAPSQNYGSPDDLRRLVQTAHAAGLSVILDLVYNHAGSEGNCFAAFAREYFSTKYESEWGQTFNFDGPGSAAVREFFCANARYWIEEFHFDGFRLDATQQLFDSTEPHIIAEIVQTMRSAAAKLGKPLYIVGENEPQNVRLLAPPEAGGYQLDALCNDDFHHSMRVALSGRHDGYYTDYHGTPQELVSALKWGFLFQGQRSHWQKKPRGTSALGLRADQLVHFFQNHDQIANSLRGERIDRLTEPALLRAATALLLLGPQTPMLFQGQEFAASAPFVFFSELGPDIRAETDRQRRGFLAQFPALASEAAAECITSCADPRAFERCKLDFSERVTHAAHYRLYQDLLRIRHQDPVIRQCSSEHLHGFVCGERAFGLRHTCTAGDRLLFVNLGPERDDLPNAEPLLAPPAGADWRLLWSSEDVRYGGSGFAPPWQDGTLHLPAHSAFLFEAARKEDPT
jgi:maltooligosyltrehalose trehalohydrolase